jgi:hypothetical protein
MSDERNYRYLQAKLGGSNYRQLFVNGRIRAEVLYRETVGQEPLTPAQVAREYNLPVEAVLEAVDYCQQHEALLNEERSRESAWVIASGRDRWPYALGESEVPDESVPRRFSRIHCDGTSRRSFVQLGVAAGSGIEISELFPLRAAGSDQNS